MIDSVCYFTLMTTIEKALMTSKAVEWC